MVQLANVTLRMRIPGRLPWLPIQILILALLIVPLQAQMLPGIVVDGCLAGSSTCTPAAPISVVNSSTGNTLCTTGDSTTVSLDSTGANFIYVGGSYHAAIPIGVSDNKGNTYTALAAVGGSASPDTRSFYAKATGKTGTGHVITITGLLPGACVATFAAVSTSSPLISENHANDVTSTTIQPGSVTPASDGSLVITTINKNIGATFTSINSSFTVGGNTNGVGGVGYGVAIAYLIQNTAGAVNPTWTMSNDQYDASIAVFK